MSTAMATPTTAEWRALGTAHHLHPFTDYKSLAGEGGARIIERAEGVWLTDTDGRRILDAMAGLWYVNVGYGRRELAEAAYRQMLELPYYDTFFKTATTPSIALAERLAGMAPEGLTRVFFANSGSEANDTVLRMVRHFWALKGQPQRQTVISRVYGYHGSTMAAASLSGMTAMHRQGGLPLPGIVHVMPPYWYGFAEPGEDADSFGLRAAKAIEEKILELGPETVAAVIAEPIQGAGGVIIPPETYWPEVQRICRTYDVLLVADEVICGFGRTGAWFGSDTYGILPDLMTVAKAVTSGYVPLSAVLVGDRVAETLIEEGGEFFHGFTYSGHPVAAAVALVNLDIIASDGRVKRSARLGPYLHRRLTEELADLPIVGEIRSRGLIGGIELVADPATRARFPGDGKVGLTCRDHCFRRDFVMRAVRDTMVFSPALVISEDEIDELARRARGAIAVTANDLDRM